MNTRLTFRVLATLLAIAFLVVVYDMILRNGYGVIDQIYYGFVLTTCTAFWWRRVMEWTKSSQYEH